MRKKQKGFHNEELFRGTIINKVIQAIINYFVVTIIHYKAHNENF